jgi:23S rRNA (pseudouridine1915-N3)-methyltransferase
VKLTVIAVGRPGAQLANAIAEYEKRAARYWPVEFIEVRKEPARGRSEDQVRDAESARLLERAPRDAELVALTRTGGDAWSSGRLARHLGEMATQGKPGAAFLIGGALGLSLDALRTADQRMRLSTFTLPHDIARLVMAEQLYRAGTIVRGEPYHKGLE